MHLHITFYAIHSEALFEEFKDLTALLAALNPRDEALGKNSLWPVRGGGWKLRLLTGKVHNLLSFKTAVSESLDFC